MTKEKPMSRRVTVFIAVGLVVALVLGGLASFFASGKPDGLEHVAADQGFAGQAEDSATADSPLADYGTSGTENERVPGGVAAVIGVGVTFVLAGGAFWLLRRASGNQRPGGESGEREGASTTT
jgi:hypothetical protein